MGIGISYWRLIEAALSIVILLNVFPSYLRAQTSWEKTHGPHGGQISSIGILPNGRILASVWGVGAYGSADTGKTWERCNGLPDHVAITAFAQNTDGSVVFAGTVADKILFSTDEGVNWFQSGFTVTLPVKTMARGSNGKVYAGCEVPGQPGFSSVYSSTDNGMSWHDEGLAGQSTEALLTMPGNTLFAGTWNGIYRASGSGWTHVLPLSFLNPVHCFSTDAEGTIYAGAQEGVYKSTDGGDSWHHVSTRRVAAMTFDAGENLFTVGTLDGTIYRSTDKGATWLGIQVTTNSVDIASLAIGINGNLFAGCWGTGLYRSSNGGDTWTQSSVPCADTRSIAFADSNTVYTATNGSGLYKSPDNGKSWKQVGLQYDVALAVAVANSGTVVAGTWENGIYRSTDQGISWSQANGGLTSYYIRKLSAHITGALFAGTWLGGIYRSSNDGVSWSPAGLDTMDVIDISFKGTNEVYALTNWGSSRLFYSSNFGTSWRMITQFTSLTYCIAVGSDGTLFAGNASGVIRSTDNGWWWQSSSGFPSDPIVYSLAVSNNGDIHAGIAAHWGRDGGVFRSTDDGVTWSRVGSELKHTVLSLSINNSGSLFAGTFEDGAYRSAQPVTSVDMNGGYFTDSFHLMQNYPNPFNPSTNIRFQLPQSELVELKVYDVLGREVATLVNEVRQSGVHDVTLDASRFAGGVYFYRLRSGPFAQARKLTIIK